MVIWADAHMLVMAELHCALRVPIGRANRGLLKNLVEQQRLNKRPISPLVDALNALGGDVRYALTNKEAPLVIQERN